MCKRLLTSLCSLALVTGASQLAHAQVPPDLTLAYHVSGQAVYTRVNAGGENFSPSLFQFRADVEATNGIFDGIGLQGMFAVPITNAEKNSLTLDITQQSGAYLTLTNPEYTPGDLRISILLGYATTELETTLPSLNTTNTDSFGGFSYGFSLQDPIAAGKNYYWTLDCARYFKDDNLRIDGCGLGVSYAF